MTIKPFRLEPGMTIGLVTPASAPASRETINKGINKLQELGYKTKIVRYDR